jgi:hypothetical protein
MDNVTMRRLRLSRAAQKKFRLHELAEHANEEIRDLVAWLNGSKETDKCKRIEGLIQLIGEVRKQMPPVTFVQFIQKEISADSGNERVWEKVRRINKQLSGYTMWPRYTGLKTIGKGMSTSLGLSSSKRRKPSPLKWEWWPRGDFAAKAAYQVVRLEENGLLESLRPCAICNKWFFAAKEWQTFCSTRCRGQHYSNSPEGRATRASYMRGYRKRLQRMNEEMKRVSRKKLT